MPVLLPITVTSLAWAALVILGFLTLLFVGAWALPGRRVLGFAPPEGQAKHYKVNGMLLWIATHFVIIGGTVALGWSLTRLVEHFWSLLVVANVVAIGWTWLLVAPGIIFQGKRPASPSTRAEPARSLPLRGARRLGIADFWMGTQLNPTWLGVDLKVWAYQPSLIGMSLLHVSFAYAQWDATGTLTPQMIAYQAFWWIYMTTHYHWETGVLSMWDVIAEKFGFMLVWGDLVLVPFFYSLGGWYLVGQTEPMPLPLVAGITAMFALGLWIFRGANAQKDRFKRDPKALIWGKTPELLGGRLLVSGWWGIGRKLNYTGEIMVYTSFALCNGTTSWVPYLLPLWLCTLLSHRAWRDEQRCGAKYGELWAAYTKRAKFRMIPFVY